MSAPREYKRTLFDRLGPDAADLLRAAGYGVMIALLVAAVLAIKVGFHLWTVGIGLAAGAVACAAALALARTAGAAWNGVMLSGSTTPYREQFSYEQSLVMRGRLPEALASFEAVIAQQPPAVDVRIRAAELYAREQHDYARALELFREAQKLPSITAGEEVYVTNRIVDLLTGPLNMPGRALVELRRLIDRHPGTTAAANARVALAALKSRAGVERDAR